MPPPTKKKRLALARERKPGPARQFLNDNFSVDEQSLVCKSGHVLFLYFAAGKSTLKTARDIKRFFDFQPNKGQVDSVVRRSQTFLQQYSRPNNQAAFATLCEEVFVVRYPPPPKPEPTATACPSPVHPASPALPEIPAGPSPATSVPSLTPTAPPLHDMLKPLSWLLGKWRSEKGLGLYPNMDDFSYAEEAEFFHVGQPNIQFSMYSWKPETEKPMARETGFIRVKPDSNHLAFLAVRNLGVATVEEGQFQDKAIEVESHTLGRLTFGKEPQTVKVKRTLKMVGDELEQVMYMETSKTPMSEHLRIRYKRI